MSRIKNQTWQAGLTLFLFASEAVLAPLVMAAQTVSNNQQSLFPLVHRTTDLIQQQEYILYVPTSHESHAEIAARFGTDESVLNALQLQAHQAGWGGSALLIPRQQTGESHLYPAYITHTLAEGETLGSWALKINRSEVELRRLNTLVIGKAAVYNLKTGDLILLPASAQVNNAVSAQTNKREQDYEELLAKAAAHTGNTYNAALKQKDQEVSGLLSQQAAGYIVNSATSAVSSSIEDALKPYGRGTVGLRANTSDNSVDIDIDFLHPLMQNDDDIVFAQAGARTFDNRNIGNFGLGYRNQIDLDLMLGGNAFIDQDFSRNHTRGGVGAEAWGNTARLAANIYAPLSDWKKSDQKKLNSDPNRMNLFERPAKGWDIRTEALIPGVPQMAATGQYFKWKGEGVDAFGSGTLESNPSGHGIGLRWQPMPLLGFTAERQQLHGGDGQWQLGVNLNWNFDQDIKKQLNAANAIALRPLTEAKQDFVDRNYNIVLNYKEEAKYKSFGFVNKSVSIQSNPVSGVAVTVAAPRLNGTPAAGMARYEVSGTTTHVSVDPITGLITVAPGATAQTLPIVARLYMPRIASIDSAKPATETLVAWAGKAAQASLDFFISTAQAIDLSSIPSNFVEVADASFSLTVLASQESGPAITAGNLSVITDNSPANGVATNSVQALVTDANNNPVANAVVSFTASNGALIAASATTGVDGKVLVTLTNTSAGDSQVIATINGTSQRVTVHFDIDPEVPVSVAITGIVNGFPQVDTALTAAPVCTQTCASTLVYEWQIETAIGSGQYAPISGAGNSDTYTPGRDDQQRKVIVKVTKPLAP